MPRLPPSYAGLFLALALLGTGCGPTGNRLNTGVIQDPRTQPDDQSSTGNQGTATPSSGGSTAPADPTLTTIPTAIARRTMPETGQYTDDRNAWRLETTHDGRFRLTALRTGRRLDGTWPADRPALRVESDSRGPMTGRRLAAIRFDDAPLIVVDARPLGDDGLLWLYRSASCPAPPWIGIDPTPDSPVLPDPRLVESCRPATPRPSLRLPAPPGPVSLSTLAGRFQGLAQRGAGDVRPFGIECDDLGRCHAPGLDWSFSAFNAPVDGSLNGRIEAAGGGGGPLTCLATTGPDGAISTLVCLGRPEAAPWATFALHRPR